MTTDQTACGPESILTIPLTVRIRRFRGALLLAEAETSVELDEVAAQVYKRLDGHRTVHDVAREIADAYGVGEEDTLPDVVELVDQLVSWGMASILDKHEWPQA